MNLSLCLNFIHFVILIVATFLMSNYINIKKQIHSKCLELSQEKIDVCNEVLIKIQEAKTADTKSSAGDKFETSREMLQAEEDRTTATLTNALKLKKSLVQIDPTAESIRVETGALVIGSELSYYISVGLGKIKLVDEVYWAISLASPIAKQMLGKSVGDEFSFNGQRHTIKNII